MCKACGYDPYLAGRVVFFPLKTPTETVEEREFDEEAGCERVRRSQVPIFDRDRGYTGICTSHHKDMVIMRTSNGRVFRMPAEKVLAFFDPSV